MIPELEMACHGRVPPTPARTIALQAPPMNIAARMPRMTITADADGTGWVGGSASSCIRGTITL